MDAKNSVPHNSVNNNLSRNIRILSKPQWEGILQYKRLFLQDKNADPLSYPYINREIAKSWIRSRNAGVNPYAPLVGRQLTNDDYNKILEKNKMLINITAPLFNAFKTLVISSSYALYLFDKDGVALLQEGDMMKPPTDQGWLMDSEHSEGEIDTVFKEKNAGKSNIIWHHKLDRTVWDENTIGTNAHTLSARLKQPIQLLGPEHYCVALNKIIASAAPIMDTNGNVIGTLVLSQPMINPPWGKNFQNLCSHTLGLITAMAAAVAAEIKLKKSNDELNEANASLRLANNTLEATLSCIQDGIITIDKTGKIIRCNSEGLRILKIKAEEIGNRNIKEFLDAKFSQTILTDIKEKTKVEETIITGNDEQPYIIDIHPVWNQDKELEVLVLKLTHVEKINAFIYSRSGAMPSFNFEDIIGDSYAIKKAIEKARCFANLTENILLIGESGTGKELFAQSIHNLYRPKGPFIAVNCAALPRELIESELFGYEGGSFTGADRTGRPGKIELAHGGTLFLDEIGDMPLELQAVLLRVLENKQVMRIGGRRYKKVDFRVITATNKDINKMVHEGLFREDLFFRLSVLTINIPPLRNRENDVEILAYYFIKKYCNKLGRKAPQISPPAMKIIKEYDWPGNVRQLQNAIIYAVNVSNGEVIEPEDLPDVILESFKPQSNGIETTRNTMNVLPLKEIEKKAIQDALLKTGGNVPLAARMLGISKSTIYRKLKELNFVEN